MPDKKPSIAIGVAAYVVLSVGVAFLAAQGGTVVQSAAGCAGCLVLLAGPMLAIWHYTSTHRVTLLAGPGAAMGAITGAVGAVVAGAITQALMAANVLPDVAETLANQRRQMLDQGMDPAAVDRAMAIGEQFGGLASNPLAGIVVNALIGAALGALFGALAASVFKKGASGAA